MTTKLRDRRAIRPEELEAILAEIEAEVGQKVGIGGVNTVGDLVALVDTLGPAANSK